MEIPSRNQEYSIVWKFGMLNHHLHSNRHLKIKNAISASHNYTLLLLDNKLKTTLGGVWHQANFDINEKAGWK